MPALPGNRSYKSSRTYFCWSVSQNQGKGRLGIRGAVFLLTVGEAGAGHLLADAAFFDEVFFQAPDLLVQEIVGLMDEAQRDIG
jgi:hypothetical protein